MASPGTILHTVQEIATQLGPSIERILSQLQQLTHLVDKQVIQIDKLNSTWAAPGRLMLAGLFALAPLDILQVRLARSGHCPWSEIFLLAPGIHTLQMAPELARGEYPATAAMTTGYVFRVENEATVAWLQGVARTGYLTEVRVADGDDLLPLSWKDPVKLGLFMLLVYNTLRAAISVYPSSEKLEHTPASLAMAMFLLARFINIAVVRRRIGDGRWHGASEPGVNGDLLILLSQDKWVRMRGMTDDLKATTSGCWLRPMTKYEKLAVDVSTMFVYGAVILITEATYIDKIVFLISFGGSAVLLSLLNLLTDEVKVKGRRLAIHGKPKRYERRLDMAEELINESCRRDWTVRLGMISSKTPVSGNKIDSSSHGQDDEIVATM